MSMNHRFLVLALLTLPAVPLALFACGQTSDRSDTTADASSATGTERGPCYPNATCNAGLVCLSQICVSADAAAALFAKDAASCGTDGGGAPVDAGVADANDGGCGAIPTFPTGCFEAGLNVCPDGTCVDFAEAGCPPIIEFVGNFPMQCERNSDCKSGGYCCAGQDFGGPLNAAAGNECLVDTTTVSNGASFYARGTSCSPTMCGSPVCASNADCRPGQHCAVMHLTEDPNGPSIGGCIK